MPTLRSKDAERIDSELEQLEAKFKEARKRKEQLAAKQYEVVGRIMLELVDSGAWTEERLHNLLRPHIKRAKDFELLGIAPQADTEPVPEEAEGFESPGDEDMVNDAEHVSEDLTGTTPDAVPSQTL